MDAEKYLPWVGVLGIVGLGVYLYRNSAPTSGYQIAPPPDNSQAVAAAQQHNENLLSSASSTFGTLVDFVNQEHQGQFALDKARLDYNQSVTLAQIDAGNQRNASNAAVKAQAHHDTWSTIGSIAGIAALAIFCYKPTGRRLQELSERSLFNVGNTFEMHSYNDVWELAQ